jgi:hypothetical protein
MIRAAGRRRQARKKPNWESHHRQLWWGNEIIRVFHREAPGQIAILAKFQAKKWARSIDVSSVIPARVKRKKQWVRNHVKNLNREIGPIKFRADGTNLNIAWSEEPMIYP